MKWALSNSLSLWGDAEKSAPIVQETSNKYEYLKRKSYSNNNKYLRLFFQLVTSFVIMTGSDNMYY